jgi:hypothetical protein
MGESMLTRRIVWLLVGLLLSTSAIGGYKPDPGALIKDLQRLTQSQDRMTMVLWLPPEFWRASLEAKGQMAPQSVDRFVKEVDPYVIVAVADGQVGMIGSVNFADPESLRNSVTIEGPEGRLLSALPDSEISPGVRNLTQMMGPVLGNMLGALGTHVAFLVFPGTDKPGHFTVNASKDGTFIVHVGSVAMRYTLPLGSLLPPMIDAKSGETFPGNYRFNPFTGVKLLPAPPAPGQPAPSPAAEAVAPELPTTQPAEHPGSHG